MPTLAQGAALRAIESGTRLERGPAMQLWRATIASPLHEMYAHDGYNYSAFPQQKTTSVVEGRHRWTLFWSLEGWNVPFFVYDPPEPTSLPGVPGRSG